MSNKRKLFIAAIAVGILVTLLAACMHGGSGAGVVVTIGLILFIVGVGGMTLTQNEENNKPDKWTILLNRDPKELTQDEKNKMLRHVEEVYARGGLTYSQYDFLKARYTGTKSFTEEYGLRAAHALDRKIASNQAIETQKKTIDTRLNVSAGFGSAAGGIGGAMTQLARESAKISQENQQLISEQQAADAELEAAMVEAVKRKTGQ